MLAILIAVVGWPLLWSLVHFLWPNLLSLYYVGLYSWPLFEWLDIWWPFFERTSDIGVLVLWPAGFFLGLFVYGVPILVVLLMLRRRR